MQQLPFTDTIEWSEFSTGLFDLVSQERHISPFNEYLYLKPLYSLRGGSTTLAEPLVKKPG